MRLLLQFGLALEGLIEGRGALMRGYEASHGSSPPACDGHLGRIAERSAPATPEPLPPRARCLRHGCRVRPVPARPQLTGHRPPIAPWKARSRRSPVPAAKGLAVEP